MKERTDEMRKLRSPQSTGGSVEQPEHARRQLLANAVGRSACHPALLHYADKDVQPLRIC
jgi:hypothetical protein